MSIPSVRADEPFFLCRDRIVLLDDERFTARLAQPSTHRLALQPAIRRAGDRPVGARPVAPRAGARRDTHQLGLLAHAGPHLTAPSCGEPFVRATRHRCRPDRHRDHAGTQQAQSMTDADGWRPTRCRHRGRQMVAEVTLQEIDGYASLPFAGETVLLLLDRHVNHAVEFAVRQACSCLRPQLQLRGSCSDGDGRRAATFPKNSALGLAGCWRFAATSWDGPRGT